MKRFYLIFLLFIFFAYSIFCQEVQDAQNIQDDSETQTPFSQFSPIQQYYINYTLKMEETQDRIKLMQNKAHLKKLGKETVHGLQSGTLNYQTKVNWKNLTGEVYLTWNNYSDDSDWTFDGQLKITSNILGNGHLYGIVKVTGPNAGQVCFDDVGIEKCYAANGNYLVATAQIPQTQVPWSLHNEVIRIRSLDPNRKGMSLDQD